MDMKNSTTISSTMLNSTVIVWTMMNSTRVKKIDGTILIEVQRYQGTAMQECKNAVRGRNAWFAVVAALLGTAIVLTTSLCIVDCARSAARKRGNNVSGANMPDRDAGVSCRARPEDDMTCRWHRTGGFMDLTTRRATAARTMPRTLDGAHDGWTEWIRMKRDVLVCIVSPASPQWPGGLNICSHEPHERFSLRTQQGILVTLLVFHPSLSRGQLS